MLYIVDKKSFKETLLSRLEFFHEPLSSSAALLELRGILEALTELLGDGNCFGGSELTNLDARAYAP